jgi:hypothetical protein
LQRVIEAAKKIDHWLWIEDVAWTVLPGEQRLEYATDENELHAALAALHEGDVWADTPQADDRAQHD